jgi:hypothetical protein
MKLQIQKIETFQDIYQEDSEILFGSLSQMALKGGNIKLNRMFCSFSSP